MNRQQALASLQAFLPEDKEIIKIINLCDLYPINGWRTWQNEYSPYIQIKQDKTIKVYNKEEVFPSSKKDLYIYANTKEVASISKRLLFIETCNNNLSFLFWGRDNRLRCRRYVNDIYLNSPPLIHSIDDLRILIKNENINQYTEVPIANKKAWVTPWPPKKEFYNEIKKEINICNSLAESLIQECSVM
jgi:hypothetical protein